MKRLLVILALLLLAAPALAAGPIWVDRVQDTSTTTGTTDFVLSGTPPTGLQAWSTVGNTNTAYYVATDTAGDWEQGLGTYSTTGPTLARTTVLASSNSGSKVSFPAGTKTISMTPDATWFGAPLPAATTCTNQFVSAISTAGAGTCATVANAALANSNITIAGHSVSLGGTQTIACGDLSNAGTGCSSAAGGMTLLGTLTTTSGSTASITGIASGYVAFYCNVSGVSFTTASTLQAALGSGGTPTYGSAASISAALTAAGRSLNGQVWFSDVAQTDQNQVAAPQLIQDSGGGGGSTATNTPTGTAAIANAIQFSGGTFDAGHIYCYGVK